MSHTPFSNEFFFGPSTNSTSFSYQASSTMHGPAVSGQVYELDETDAQGDLGAGQPFAQNFQQGLNQDSNFHQSFQLSTTQQSTTQQSTIQQSAIQQSNFGQFNFGQSEFQTSTFQHYQQSPMPQYLPMNNMLQQQPFYSGIGADNMLTGLLMPMQTGSVDSAFMPLTSGQVFSSEAPNGADNVTGNHSGDELIEDNLTDQEREAVMEGVVWVDGIPTFGDQSETNTNNDPKA
ncbi:hypothetical protein AK830_g4029 [Neonectria ditissima]|uniref:Uncharacterized protein n=1 Tax=Neonectria ditissima TaxID=78410 RepID=A0A0P7BA03_9HYPO|nr:hypothetical protein AK830_g4029 [Neonectria ditissima]